MRRGLLRAMLSRVGGSFIELKCARFATKLAFLSTAGASASADGDVVVVLSAVFDGSGCCSEEGCCCDDRFRAGK